MLWMGTKDFGLQQAEREGEWGSDGYRILSRLVFAP